MRTFNIIAAVDENFGIGKSGSLPWHLPGDLKHFSSITKAGGGDGIQNAVVMGRKTWDSLPADYKPLPNRINLVLTRGMNIYLPGGVLRADSLDNALNVLTKNSDFNGGKVFVIGGEQVFQMAVTHAGCQRIYLTHILGTFDCDTFFPRDLSAFKLISQAEPSSDGNISYYFTEYLRIGLEHKIY